MRGGWAPTHKTPAVHNFYDIYNFHMTIHCDVINAKFLNFAILINLQNGSKQSLDVERHKRNQEVGAPLTWHRAAHLYGPSLLV